MLEFFRHHRGAFLIFLTVIIIISFSFWGGYTRSGSAGGLQDSDRLFTIYNRDYTQAEAKRYQRFFEIARGLGMFQFAIEVLMASRNFETRDSSPLDFTLNLIVIQKQMEAFGIHPSDEEALKALQDLPAFQKDGKFDAAQAAQVEENLGAYGFRSGDLLELVKYQIGFKKLKDLVTQNYSASPFAAAKSYAAMYQTIKGSTIEFKLEDFKKGVKLEDAEVQKSYDEKKDTFKTPEKRSIQWVLFEKPADLDKITDEGEKKKKQADYIEKVRAFAEKTHQPGAKLADLAAAEKLKLEKADSFTRDAPPEALKNSTAVVEAAFALAKEATTITDPKEGDKGYYIAELVAIDEPKQQELAEVKEQIRNSLIEQKAREALATAVNDAREALGKGLKDGGKIEDLVKQRQLTLTPLPDFSPNTPPPGLPNAYDIAREAESAAPNSLGKPVNTDTGAVLVYVSAKELRKQPEGDSMKKSVEASATSKEQDQVFRSWFGRQKDAANVKLTVPVT